MVLCAFCTSRRSQLMFSAFYSVVQRVLYFLFLLISKVHCMCIYTCVTDASHIQAKCVKHNRLRVSQ